MATYTDSDGYSVRTFSNVSRASASSRTTVESVDVVQERMPEYHYYRTLWWEKGDFHQKANWEEATLPYTLAVGVTLEDYERRSEVFNVRGCWEWANGEVVIYELPSKPHEVCIRKIAKEIESACRNSENTSAEIYSLGSTRTYADDSAKEADDSFRPKKPAVDYPNGSDKKTEPWPNLVIEVAYSETIEHVTEKVRNHWLAPGRVHDAIVVKIDPVPPGQVPTRMVAWHYCIDAAAGRRTRNTLPIRTTFEFGTHDALGNPFNPPIGQGVCIINIQLSCLYHDAKPPITIPTNLPNPIPLDFYFVQRAITEMYDI